MIDVILIFVSMFSFTLLVLQWRVARQTRRLNQLLSDMCLQAWMLRHAPIWVPWQEMMGVKLRIVVTDRKGKDVVPL